jgi:hypothetical protein
MTRPFITPEPSDNEEDMLGQPMPSGGDDLERPADLSAERPPSPLEYFPEPDALRNHIIAAEFSTHPESDRRDSSASIDTGAGIAADRVSMVLCRIQITFFSFKPDRLGLHSAAQYRSKRHSLPFSGSTPFRAVSDPSRVHTTPKSCPSCLDRPRHRTF